MNANVPVTILTLDDEYEITVTLELPRKCPHCETAFKELPINGYSFENSEVPTIVMIYFCPHCEHFFVCDYITPRRGLHQGDLIFHAKTYPVPNTITHFSDNIVSLSPSFVEIYNQAETAENNGLTEICGLGYRKALEFLVKDFAIHNNADDEERIKAMSLSQCITNYCNNEYISPLAKRSARLGNDEAHYIRKHEDYDVSDMKRFITALISFIDMFLTTEAAKSIAPAH